MKLMPVLAAFVLISCMEMTAADSYVTLATFDGKDKSTTWNWAVTDDPVMGGLSHSTLKINRTEGVAVWHGENKIVPKLHAPGFCNLRTDSAFGKKANDASAFTHLLMRVRSTIKYTGFKVDFSAERFRPDAGSFKSIFNVTRHDGIWHTVSVPFSDFSKDTSAFTGRCDTTDPDGRKHRCCSKEHPEVCPTKNDLKDMTQLSLLAEGVAGKFHLEVKWIRAGYGADGCSKSEYCCPDAKHCLTPTKKSCKDDSSVCSSDETCCPLTKLCVGVGNACESPCAGQDSYCCPDALACLTPTKPGVLCDGADSCEKGEVCCPLTNLCVKPKDKCDPGFPSVPVPSNDRNNVSSLATKWTCDTCGHVYDPEKDGGGKPFEDLPDTWECPVCGAPKSAYGPAILPNGKRVYVHLH